ncbi:hypothetical protein EDD11_002940 [Mortierella claussenii]|nr:hypothetical protein EDD11_002940 [Mortierella claussenii]
MTDRSLMDIDSSSPALETTPKDIISSNSSSSLVVMPENIWLDIFSYLTLEEKFKVSSTCRTWHRILADPSLYTHLVLDNMEFNTLVLCMQQFCRLAPRIRSLRIANCYSSFISKTTVPVQNTAIMHHFPQQPGMHSLYTHITSFTLPRRREEYRKLGFTLHQDFSRALVYLMEQSQESIKCLEIQDNFLDLEMTELIFCIVRYGRHLEHILYDRNRDGGFVAPEVVCAITAACPQIKSFRGQHAISDTVLRRMMTGWEDLKSITLAPYQTPTMGTKEISLEGLWSLLECGKVETLELLDLECVSNENVRNMMYRVKQLQSMSMSSSSSSSSANHPSSPLAPNHPFAHLVSRFPSLTEAQSGSSSSASTATRALPGESVRHLTLSKYTSSPLTLPGFGALLKLFPNLETLQFTTNYFAYDHQFQGLSREIFEEEIMMVDQMIQGEMADRWSAAAAAAAVSASAPARWVADWHAPLTDEQRLRVGIMRPSQ